MVLTIIQGMFKPFKKYLPRWIHGPIRNIITAFMTPILFSYGTGHFKSSFKAAAVSRSGKALPWYTYPCIDFIKNRDYNDKTVLEFGGGQSTIWWAERARHVVTFEGNKAWHDKIKTKMPSNVELFLVSIDTSSACVKDVSDILCSKGYTTFDIVVIDGLARYEMIDIARGVVSPTGAIICDNAEGYDFFEGFKDSDLCRVDFFGYAPGVILPHCTSIYFQAESFLFSSNHQIPIISDAE